MLNSRASPSCTYSCVAESLCQKAVDKGKAMHQLQTDRKTDRQTGKPTDRQTDRETIFKRLYIRVALSLHHNESVRNNSYENVFCVQVHFHENPCDLRMIGFTCVFVLKEKHKVTRKWLIYLSQILTPERP